MCVYDIGFVSISEQLALGQFRGHALHSQFRGSSVTIVIHDISCRCDDEFIPQTTANLG